MKPMENDYYNWCGGRRASKLIEINKFEWIGWWATTGKYKQRGSYRGQYYMSRIDKTMPFSINNIELKQHGKKRGQR